MFKVGMGSLTETHNSDIALLAEQKDVLNFHHSEYMKFPVSQKLTLDKGSLAEMLCDVCENGIVAVASCLECQQNLCTTCKSRHKNMRSSVNHHFLEFESDIDTSERFTCFKHQREKTLYCIECSKMLCIPCKLLYHAHHATRDIDECNNDVGLEEKNGPNQSEAYGINALAVKDEHVPIPMSINNINETESFLENNLSMKVYRDQTASKRSYMFSSSIVCGTDLRSLRDLMLKLEGDTCSIDSTSCKHSCRLCVFKV